MVYEVTSTSITTTRNRMREIVSTKRVAYGGWCMLPDTITAEIMSACGSDWLCIDLQHGLLDEQMMRAMVQVAAIRQTPVLVRVTWNEPSAIMRALDAGADGVIVPMVNTPEEACRATAASRYPPLGKRSWGPIRASMMIPDFTPTIGNENAVCIVMIETVEGFSNLEKIADVPGVDGIFVGPSDLAISYSGAVIGDEILSRNVEMMAQIAKHAAARNLVTGTTCNDLADVARWRDMGYSLLSLMSDAALLSTAMRAQLAAAREVRGN